MIRSLLEQHPQFSSVLRICKKLSGAGFQALLAGGSVRDALRGKLAQDFDLATDANPDQIEHLFEKTRSVGRAFGVMIVVDQTPEGENSFEVSRFRSDGAYVDGRHPESVVFSSAKEDALRRDFTINALFYDLQSDVVVDYVSGQKDLKSQLIRCVGKPEERFREDALRILRALRFSTQLGFRIEDQTWKALCQQAPSILKLSAERIQSELAKSFKDIGAFEQVRDLWLSSGVLSVLFPEFRWSLSGWMSTPKSFLQNSSRQDLATEAGKLTQAWIHFFIWMFQSQPQGFDFILFDDICKRLRLSRELSQCLARALDWFVRGESKSREPLGQWIERSYDFWSFYGQSLWRETEVFSALASGTNEDLQQKWLKMIDIRNQTGARRPEPLIRAADLPSQYKGRSIGEALQKVYWAQLEGVVKTQKEGLVFLSSTE